MAQYLVSIHHADDYDPTTESEEMHHDIDVLNDEIVAKGIRTFVGGLHLAKTAKSLVTQPNGQVAVTSGAYLKTNEHVGGFWVLECKNEEEALEWGRKAAIACRAPVEVRQFHG